MKNVILNVADLRSGDTGLKKGDIVSYGDQANIRQKAVVISNKRESEYSMGLPCIFLESYRKDQVHMMMIEGAGGWELHKGEAMTDAEIDEIISKHNERQAELIENRRKETDERNKKLAEGKILFDKAVPGDAKAVIVAIKEIDKSDSMTDYFATEDGKTYILAWSKHNRDLFPEMRKAALNSDDEEIRKLNDAPKEAEHREKWSMGKGYYLKDDHGYSNGWKIEKWSLADYMMDKIYTLLAEGALKISENAPNDKKEETNNTISEKAESVNSGAENNADDTFISNYKGHDVLNIPMANGRTFSFGLSKAQLILDNIDAIKKFVKNNQ